MVSQKRSSVIMALSSVELYRNVRIIDLNLSVGITNLRRLNLIFIPSVTVKHYILYKFTLIFIYIFYK